MNPSILAIAALVPIAIGPLPSEERTLVMTLCDGGSITIPIGDDDPEGPRNCHQQACHAGSCREKNKRPI